MSRTAINAKARTTTPPSFVPPQLCLLVTTPPSTPGWVHEYEYDGYRMHLRLFDGAVQMLTRAGLDWTEKYSTIARASGRLRASNAYIDGELRAVDAEGHRTLLL